MRLNDGDCLHLYKELRALSEQDLAFKLKHLSPTDRKVMAGAFIKLQHKADTSERLSKDFIGAVLAKLQVKTGGLYNLWQQALKAVGHLLHLDQSINSVQEDVDPANRLKQSKRNLESLYALKSFKLTQAYPEFVSLIQFLKVLPKSAAEANEILAQRIHTVDMLIHAAKTRKESPEYIALLERVIKTILIELRNNREDYSEQLNLAIEEAQVRVLEFQDTSELDLEMEQLRKEQNELETL